MRSTDYCASTVLRSARRALAGRRLVWFGTRGEDGEALLQVPELAASFAISAPLRSARLAPECNQTLERLAGDRPDLDRHDIDLDRSEPAWDFRRNLLREVSTRCVVVTYRPARLVSTMAFSMTETMTLAGLFKDRQTAFEHKPWVETTLAKRGVRTLGWRYVAHEHCARVERLARGGPVVLRASRASGGVGVVRVDCATEIAERWPADDDGFVGVAPYLGEAVPLNLSGCVYSNGVVRLHPPSVQLIGIPTLTERPFGYCGNDFGAVGALDDDVLDQFDALGRAVGDWLHSERYVGAFGIDALALDGQIHFTEVNARFQGSSALSAEIADELELPNLFVEHLAASLGVAPVGDGLTVREWVRRQPSRSHLVVHNISELVRVRAAEAPSLPALERGARLTQLLAPGVRGLPGAALCRLVLPRSVTTSGFEIDEQAQQSIDELHACFGQEPQTIAEDVGAVAN
jgi:hypothetical protein